MSRGTIRRKDKEIDRAEIDRLLQEAGLAHFATVSANGDPYVVPNLFVYADGLIHLHTSLGGHFRSNIEARPHICFEIAEMGTIYPYGEFECDTTVSYASVIGFGTVRIDNDSDGKARFFDRLMAKYGDPKWDRAKSFYPRLDQVTVYTIEIERLTGKRGPLLAVSDQWPAKNMTKSPGAVAPRRN